ERRPQRTLARAVAELPRRRAEAGRFLELLAVEARDPAARRVEDGREPARRRLEDAAARAGATEGPDDGRGGRESCDVDPVGSLAGRVRAEGVPDRLARRAPGAAAHSRREGERAILAAALRRVEG